MTTLKPGDPAPDFKGVTTDGKPVALDRMLTLKGTGQITGQAMGRD